MAEALTVEALSVAAFATALANMPHETRANVTATERGEPWACVSVSPMTDTARAVFPLYADGVRGDTGRRVGHRGATVRGPLDQGYRVVIERSRRMFRES